MTNFGPAVEPQKPVSILQGRRKMSATIMLPQTTMPDATATQAVPIEYRGQRVITLHMMDEIHRRVPGTAKRTFLAKKAKLVEGRDYCEVQQCELPQALLESA
jgi:ORF6N domain